MPGSFSIRFGAVCGWIGLIGVVSLFIVIPTLLAGQPPTSTTDPATVVAYFSHSELAPMNGVLGPFVGVLAIIPFAIGLRAAIREGAGERSSAFADLGLAVVVVAAPIYLISGALAAALVDAAGRDAGTFATLFRLYDVLYDAGADVLEGGWIAAFSVAMIGGRLPAWLAWLGIAVGLSRWVKAFAPFVPAVGVITLPSGLLFILWFISAVVVLTRVALRTRTGPAPAAARGAA